MGESSRSSANEPAGNLSLKMRVALAGIRKKFGGVSAASYSELEAAQMNSQKGNSGVLLLDVREKQEYDVSHLPQARWIDESSPAEEKMQQVSKLVSSLPDIAELDKVDVFAYCSIGYRSSALIRHILQHKNQSNLPANVMVNFYDVQGGIFQWANENRVMVDSENRETKHVHPYNFVWGKLIAKEFRYQLSK